MKKLITLIILIFTAASSTYAVNEVTLADFENGIPCSEEGDVLGFRKKDLTRAQIVPVGAEGTMNSALFSLLPSDERLRGQNDLFFQGNVRRMYLSTKSPRYDKYGPNALSFWIKVPADSELVSNEQKNTIGVWTYHWRPGDAYVGGESNKELATDSMMHAYSNFRLTGKTAGKWVNVVLSASAFQQSRYYYHFYAAEGTTDELLFFPSLRQLQFHFFSDIAKEEEIQLDQLKLITIQPTAIFKENFYKTRGSKEIGNIEVPVIIENPTDKNRKYRVFISSFLGVHRDVLYNAHVLTDSFLPPRKIQELARGDGGLGVSELIDNNGNSLSKMQREIFIAAGGVWIGKLIHYIKPEMLGPVTTFKFKGQQFTFRRDTLTTSVIVWDPYNETVNEMKYIRVLPSNADDGRHPPPSGFPEQKRPPKGWGSEDIPVNQVGGYFVSVIQLSD